MNFQTSNWKPEIMKHPKYHGIHRSNVQSHTDLEKDELIRMLKQMIEYHDTYANDAISAYAAATRSDGRVFYTDHGIYFSDEACDELRKLVDIVEKSNDERFNLTYVEHARVAMPFLEKPIVTVVDVYEESVTKTIEYENHKIVFKNGDAIATYQLYDIVDGLSVGDPFTDSFITTDDIKSAAQAKSVFEQQIGIRNTLDGIKVTMVSPEVCTYGFKLELANILKQGTIRTCKVCGYDFIISNKEKQWFKDRDMYLPKACARCRHQRRKEKAMKESREANIMLNRFMYGEDE